MSQIISLLSLIAKGLNAIACKIKRDAVQDRSRRVDADPAREFIDTFGVRSKKSDTSADTGERPRK